MDDLCHRVSKELKLFKYFYPLDKLINSVEFAKIKHIHINIEIYHLFEIELVETHLQMGWKFTTQICIL